MIEFKMLNGGKKSSNLAQRSLIQVESSEDLEKNEYEEGKAVSLVEMSLRSPHIYKKKMDFGHSNQNEYMWTYTLRNHERQSGITLDQVMKDKDIKVAKVVDKWRRAIVLDSNIKRFIVLEKGRLYQRV